MKKSLLPTLRDFAFLTPVLFLFGRMNGARGLLGDADTGWHIRTGEWILEHHAVPTKDIFSFTRPGAPWYAWEWLADILMALAHRAGGLPAVVFGSLLLLCGISLFLFRFILRRCGSPGLAWVLTLVASAGSSLHWLARPHLFSLLFVLVFYDALDSWPRQRLWLLPLLMVLWTNLHGGFFLGIVLLGTFATGQWLHAALALPESRPEYLRLGCLYALLAVACFAASFLNPYTWQLHRHLFDYLTHPGYFQDIQEFAPLSLTHPLARFYETMLLLSAGTVFWCFRRQRYAEALMLLMWLHLALLASRNVPIFFLLSAVPVSLALAEGLNRVKNAAQVSWLQRLVALGEHIGELLARTGMQPGWPVFSVLVVVLVGWGMLTPAPAAVFESSFDPAVYPTKALAHLRSSDPVFADDEWGDYLIYSTQPTRKVFIDGRSDFYGVEFEVKYQDILHARNQWQTTLRDYQVDTVLARPKTSLATALAESREWRPDYHDTVVQVFRRIQP